MQIVLYAASFLGLAWLSKRAGSRRKFMALAVMVAMLLTLIGAPQPAHSQAPTGIPSAIQSVLSVINGLIQTALTSITGIRAAMSNLEQLVAWPQQLIQQARAQVAQMIGQYRVVMASMIHLNLLSATLPVPRGFEMVIRDHQINNFAALTLAFGNTYGSVPVQTAASSVDRAMSDMDDALALDSLKLLKAGDQATDVEIQSADSIENVAAQAAPGSAPFLTAAAIVSGINSQALTQKMLAAELRQEAARLAHQNALRKDSANSTTQLRGILVNLLQHQ